MQNLVHKCNINVKQNHYVYAAFLYEGHRIVKNQDSAACDMMDMRVAWRKCMIDRSRSCHFYLLCVMMCGSDDNHKIDDKIMMLFFVRIKLVSKKNNERKIFMMCRLKNKTCVEVMKKCII